MVPTLAAYRGDALDHAGMPVRPDGADDDPVVGVAFEEQPLVLDVGIAGGEGFAGGRLVFIRAPVLQRPDRGLLLLTGEAFGKGEGDLGPGAVLFEPPVLFAQGGMHPRQAFGGKLETAMGRRAMEDDALGVFAGVIGDAPGRVDRVGRIQHFDLQKWAKPGPARTFRRAGPGFMWMGVTETAGSGPSAGAITRRR